VAQALRGAIAALPDKLSSSLPEGAVGGGWEPFGIHGEALETQEYTAARAQVVERVDAMIAKGSRAA